MEESEWIIKDENVKFFNFINVILMVCIDCLLEQVCEMVKVVVVIGWEFEVLILNEVMCLQESFLNCLNFELCNEIEIVEQV